MSSVYERLAACRDDRYREFQSKLVPNISADTILGVRTPDMRRIAKEVYGTKEAEEFLATLPHVCYEENLVHFFLISMIRDFDTCVSEVERFLPYIDCWPVCDQSSPKVFAKNHGRLLPLVRKWIDSDHVYTARFGMRMLMNEFLGEDFREEYLSWVAAKKGEDYYLKMMVAWYFEKHCLDPWTHKKAIQKAIESFRVTEEHKEYLRSLR